MRQSQEGRALRQFTLSTGKSAGRNSSGRLTLFQQMKLNFECYVLTILILLILALVSYYVLAFPLVVFTLL
jgi:hypothetical protein